MSAVSPIIYPVIIPLTEYEQQRDCCCRFSRIVGFRRERDGSAARYFRMIGERRYPHTGIHIISTYDDLADINMQSIRQRTRTHVYSAVMRLHYVSDDALFVDSYYEINEHETARDMGYGRPPYRYLHDYSNFELRRLSEIAVIRKSRVEVRWIILTILRAYIFDRVRAYARARAREFTYVSP